MPTLDERYDTTKSIAVYHKMAQISLGIACPPPYNYHAVRRMIEVDSDEELGVSGDTEDPMAELLVEAAHDMLHKERSGSIETEVDVGYSIGALFDPDCSVVKQHKPRLFIAVDLRSGSEASICGLATTCEWTRDENLGTDRFTQTELRRLQLPRIDSNWLLVDVIRSRHRGCGVLLAVQIYLLACRSKQYRGVAAIAVTQAGKKLFESLGFSVQTYREGGVSKSLCYAEAGSLSLARIKKRLSFPGDTNVVESVCFREGLTARTAGNVYGRC